MPDTLLSLFFFFALRHAYEFYFNTLPCLLDAMLLRHAARLCPRACLLLDARHMLLPPCCYYDMSAADIDDAAAITFTP